MAELLSARCMYKEGIRHIISFSFMGHFVVRVHSW